MRTKTVLASAVVLILVLLACGLPETPTLEPGAVGTAVAQTVQAELTAGEPADTPPPGVTETIPPAAEVGNAPAGLFKPVRGFNWQWCNTASVRDGLGWALEGEAGYNTLWQEFEHGHAFQSRANHIFVFYDDGTWDYIE